MSQKKRTIAAVTTSRADYSHLYWPLRRLQEAPDIDLKIIAIGAHLSPEFGETVDEIEADGFNVDDKVECLMSSDTDVGMAKTIGVGMLGITDVLARMRPDILLLIADRHELLAPACAALALRIPIAHIEGGEISEGAIDDAVRNAITKMSHIHFTPTRKATERVIAMGEEPWRVHQVGAPSLDHLVLSDLPSPEQIHRDLSVDPRNRPIVVSYHPVTLLDDTTEEFYALLAALEQRDEPLIFCFPNSDAGSRSLIEHVKTFRKLHDNTQLYVNLPAKTYWSLLREARCLVGNSSSGIMETASLKLPTVNIGLRQQGRERAENIIDVDADTDQIGRAIDSAVSEQTARQLENCVNPYGDGQAGSRICTTLSGAPLGSTLLIKRALESGAESKL